MPDQPIHHHPNLHHQRRSSPQINRWSRRTFPRYVFNTLLDHPHLIRTHWTLSNHIRPRTKWPRQFQGTRHRNTKLRGQHRRLKLNLNNNTCFTSSQL